jgi:hypothetical protein
MQDRSYRIDKNLLQRTAGPYIGVKERTRLRGSALRAKAEPVAPME